MADGCCGVPAHTAAAPSAKHLAGSFSRFYDQSVHFACSRMHERMLQGAATQDPLNTHPLVAPHAP
jgi:hypothetical protein